MPTMCTRPSLNCRSRRRSRTSTASPTIQRETWYNPPDGIFTTFEQSFKDRSSFNFMILPKFQGLIFCHTLNLNLLLFLKYQYGYHLNNRQVRFMVKSSPLDKRPVIQTLVCNHRCNRWFRLCLMNFITALNCLPGIQTLIVRNKRSLGRCCCSFISLIES